MSKVIDNRVVEMQFDNAHFESNVKTSLSTLDKLKQALKLDGATKGFENISTAAKNVNMSPLSGAVETVGVKFSALQVAATTALANITSAAMNAGANIVKAFTLDPIITGFQEYETQINAVQTVLANTQSKGTTLDDVNAALDELNKYADKTIYNFTEMTRNIGTFTAAGVDLDTSVSAIKGIANLAAVSGSNAQQASTAMYQLSQALAAGTVKLMDWNSVVNAGMGGQVFQDSLKETARVHGVAIDDMIKKEGSFRETLSKGWLTSEILLETLSKFTGDLTAEQLKSMGYTEQQIEGILKLGETANDAATKVKTFTQLMDTLKEAAQSGWTQTWEILVGDFEEAKGLWTEISDIFGGMINESSEARNKVLEDAMTSNWDKMIKKLNAVGIQTDEFEDKVSTVLEKNGFDVDKLVKKYGSLEEAFQSGSVSSYYLKRALKSLTEDVEGIDFSSIKEDLDFGDTGENVKKVQTALKQLGYDIGVFGSDGSGIDGIIGSYTEAAIKAFQEANNLKVTGVVDEETLAALEKATQKTMEWDESIDGLIDGITELGGRENLIQSLRNVFEGLMSVITPIKEAFRDIFPPITAEQVLNLTENIRDLTASFKLSEDTAKNLKSTFKGLFAILDIIKTVAGGALSIALRVLGNVLGITGTNVLEVTGAVGEAIAAFRDWLFENNLIVKGFEKLAEMLGKGVSAIKEWWNSFKSMDVVQENLKRFGDAFSKIFEKVPEHVTKVKDAFSDFVDDLSKLDGLSLENIGQALTKFWDFLGEAFSFDGLFDGLGDAFASLGDDIWNVLPEWAKTAVSSIGDAASVLKEHFSGIGAAFSTLIEDIKNLDGVFTLDNISAIFAKFWQSIKDVFSNLDGVYDNAVAALESFRAAIEEKLSAIGGAVGKVIDFIKEKFNLDWSKVFAVGILGGLLFTVKKVTDVIQLFTNPFESLGGMFENVGDVVKSIGKYISSQAFLQTSEGIKNLAISIAILAGSLIALTFVDTDKLWSSIGVLGALAGGVAVLAAALGLLGKYLGTVQQFSLASVLLSLGAAFLMIAWCTKIISGISDEGLYKGVVIISLFGGLVLALTAVSAIAGPNASQAGSMILKVAAAFLLMTATMKIIDGMTDDALYRGITILAAFGALVTVLTAVSSLSGKNADKAGAMILKVSVAFALMATTIKIIDSLSDDALYRGVTILSVFGALVAALTLVSSLAGKHADKAGALILKVGVAFTLLAVTMKIIDGLSDEALYKGIVTLTAFAGLVTALIAISKLAGEHADKAGSMIMKVGVAFLLLSAAMAIISLLDPKDVFQAIAAISALSILFMGLIAVGTLAKEAQPPIIALTVAIGVLAIAIAALSLIDGASLMTAAGALSLTMATFAALVAALKFINTGKGTFLKTIGTLTVLTLVVGALALIIGMLANECNAESALASAASLSALLISMSAACAILSKINVGAAVNGALALAAFVGVIGALLAALGGLAQIPGLTWLLDEGTAILSQVGTAIGSFIGSIGAGIGTGFTSGLPQMGEDIAAFANALGSIKIDSDVVGSISSLIDVLLKLTAVDVLDRLTGGTGETLTNFASQLAPFGRAMVRFSEIVSGNIDHAALESAQTAAEILSAMANSLPAQPGVIKSWFVDSTMDMATFGAQLAPFGRAMVRFSEIVKEGGISQVALNSAKTAAEILSAMANSLPKEPGPIKSWFVDSTMDMTTFGAQLAPFGRAMVRFSEIISEGEINTEALESARTAAGILSAMASSLPKEPGVIKSWFVDSTMDMTTFGAQLAPFGRAMVRFSEIVGNGAIDPSAIESAAASAEILFVLANSLPKEPGAIKSWFVDSTISMEDFGKQLVPFGRAMVSFSRVLSSGIDQSAIDSASSAAKALSAMASSLPEETGTIKAWFCDHTMSMEDFGKQLVKFGEAIVGFSEVVSTGVNQAAIDGCIDAALKVVDMANNLPEDMDLSRISEGLTDLGDAMKTFSESISGEIDLEAITSVTTAGKTLAETAKIMPDKVDLSRITNGLSAFGDAMVDFSEAVSGENMDYTAVSKATVLGKKIVEMVKDAPSKSLTNFVEGVSTIGDALVSFSSSVEEGLDEGAIEDAVKAGNDIIDMVAMIPDTIFITDFIDNLGSLAAALVDFSTNVSEGVDLEAVRTATEAGTVIAYMTEAIPDTVFIDDFADMIGRLGTALVEFSTNVTGGVNTEAVTTAVNAGHQIADMVSLIPDAYMADDFVAMLGDLGTALVNFSTNVTDGINPEAVTKAVTAGNQIAGMVSLIPDSFMADDFIAMIGDLGTALVAFSTNVTNGVNPEAVATAVTAGKQIAGLVSEIPDSFMADDFVAMLGSLGTALVSFSTNVTDGINAVAIEIAVNAGYQVARLVESLPVDTDISGFANNLTTLSSALITFSNDMAGFIMPDLVTISENFKSLGTSGIDGFLAAFMVAEPKAKTAGENLVGGVVSGAEGKSETLNSAFSTMASAAVTTVNNYYANFSSAGAYVVEGFAAGITANTFMAEAAAAAMAEAALESAKEVLREHSPSKAFYEIGDYGVDGFVNPFYDRLPDAYDAGSAIGDSSLQGLSKCLSKVKDVIENDIDAQPTIRPVLDLSNVKAGTGAMNEMLNWSPVISSRFANYAGSISASMNNRQNETVADVIGAIKSLRSDIRNNPGTTYQINGITYDDGSNVASAVKTLVRAAKVERRI